MSGGGSGGGGADGAGGEGAGAGAGAGVMCPSVGLVPIVKESSGAAAAALFARAQARAVETPGQAGLGEGCMWAGTGQGVRAVQQSYSFSLQRDCFLTGLVES